MTLSTLKTPAPHLEIRDARASSVIVHRVPSGSTDAFLAWEAGISEAAKAFPGYRGTEIYPPAVDGAGDWVVIVHFCDAEDLGRWIESPVRAEWAAKLPGTLGDFRLKTLPCGFGPWFAAQLDHPGGQPAPWKMALTVLLGLYPTVMLLTLALGPLLAPLGMAGSMLVGNVLSVSILQWGVMLPLQRILRPWLAVGADTGRSRPALWLVLILIVLAGQVILFRQIGG
jgi:antibiotic biosynthesis monooxygenase (ABM) superfamily enzyme